MIKKILVILLLLPACVLAGIPHKEHSVLSSGNWYKFAVTHTGIHKITYEELAAAGMDAAAVVPGNLRVYGNGGGILPELNSAFRLDDLRENTILVHDGGDGQFNPGDYLLFYGESADSWKMDPETKLFTHIKNFYSDTTWYFITADSGPGKRVAMATPSTLPASSYSRNMSDYAAHDIDLRNLIKSGKMWVGEEFNDTMTSLTIPFYFPKIDTLSAVRFNTFVVAKCAYSSKFTLTVNNTELDQLVVDATDPGSLSIFAKTKLKGSLLFTPKDSLVVRLNYNLPTYNSLGWLNYIELNLQRKLAWRPSQLAFRDVNSFGPGKVTEFIMADGSPDVVVWDITRADSVLQVPLTQVDSTLHFRMQCDSLHQFVAFDGSMFYSASFAGKVENQDIHATQPADLVIVTNPLFIEQANRLAAFHEEENGTSSVVVSTDKIYNEFASGQHDITAIRDFVKMLYDRASGSQPKYVLLVGDGSYDYKDRVPNNTNFVPTFESTESLKYTGTYVTDDYFGIMGDNEGTESAGTLELGIGRFPVSDTGQVTAIVDKIIHYSDKTDSTLTSWRNNITFIADDEDANLHVIQAEQLCSITGSNYPVFNVNKVYSDSYMLYSTASGPRYPDVNKAISAAVAQGNLIINYTGHGGEDGWSGEKILTIPDIESWTNYNKLPVFVTATCEFSRFDNPQRFSAGEMVIVKPRAGAIALYTTTRLALATANFKLDSSFFYNLMQKDADGKYIKMGDLFRISKNNNGNNANIRNFVLLGDPAQTISFPKYNIVTKAINGKPVGTQPDTLLGLSTVEVTGEVVDAEGNRIDGFNGTVSTKVFDKAATYRTLGNQPKSFPQSFQVQNILLHDGRAAVTDGSFKFSFIVPAGASSRFGRGKISYYAENGTDDGNGFSKEIIIGGKDPTVDPVNPGPSIRLYMDNRSFISGGKTSADPFLIADLSDDNGINSLGLGIGHEIIAAIDSDWVHAIVMNDYYTADLDTYRSGTVYYPYYGLAPGFHRVTMKAWDLFNNMSEQSLDFYVYEDPNVPVSMVINYPNPFSTGTRFSFTLGDIASKVEIQVQIFSINGEPVKTLTYNMSDPSDSMFDFYWDGTDDYGNRLSAGVYPYRVIFKGDNGAYSETSQKLIIFN
jgi:hypothetical protein